MGEDRHQWEGRWERPAATFDFHVDEVPQKLVQLLESGTLPKGRALDLGCGASIITTRIARDFSPTLGIDYAFGALVQAKRLPANAVHPPAFCVADAAALPLVPGSFMFVFDRGCLQNLLQPQWPSYFREVDRVLHPGGMFQLFCSRPCVRLPPLLSVNGLRARVRWYRHVARVKRRRGSPFPTQADIRRLLPSSLQILQLEDVSFRTNTGRQRIMTQGVFRKRPTETGDQ